MKNMFPYGSCGVTWSAWKGSSFCLKFLVEISTVASLPGDQFMCLSMVWYGELVFMVVALAKAHMVQDVTVYSLRFIKKTAFKSSF